MVLFLWCCSKVVERQGFSRVAYWHSYGVCFSCGCRYSLGVRQEVFLKVERQYMLGLRSRDPEMRQKFFTLYHDSISKTLFTRLQYIIQTQEWEALSDVFWLKQSLDLLLAILVEHEPITLAPNSAQVSFQQCESVLVTELFHTADSFPT